MPNEELSRQPGDVILDRYMPNATSEEREAARENLRAALELLIRIEERRALRRSGKLDSLKRHEDGRFDS